MPSQSTTVSHQLATTFLSEQMQDGWWPYQSGQGAATEPTAWCALALVNNESARKAAARFLQKSQNKDGGWSTTPGAGPSDWTSSLALLTLNQIAPDLESCIGQAVSYLLNHRSELFDPLTVPSIFLLWVLCQKHLMRGWPWNAGSFHFVEPTSYAMIALRQSWRCRQKEISSALACAEDLLFYNACAGGGWNSGNRKILDWLVPPYPITTAQALIALQHLPEAPAVQSGLAYLTKVSQEENTVLSLSWAILAIDALGQGISQQLTALLAHQEENGSFGTPFKTGLAACALAAANGANPVKSGIPEIFP